MADPQDTPGARSAGEEFESQLDAMNVRLESFEGPLDLLLHLIRKHEVNIYDIPIALITEQYLQYLSVMQELDLDLASEFLVMAATLIHVKSKMLLPRPQLTPEDLGEDVDPRDELVRRLLEHQKFKAAAELLHERETVRNAQWTRPDARVEAIAGDAYEPELEVDLFGLLAAFRRVLERSKAAPVMPLPPEEVSIESRIDQLLERLSESEACGFEDLFDRVSGRGELIVTFLALLEMIRLKLIRVFQQGQLGTIRIYKRARPQDAPHPIHDPEDEYRAHHAGSTTPLLDAVPLDDELSVEAEAGEDFHAASADAPASLDSSEGDDFPGTEDTAGGDDAPASEDEDSRAMSDEQQRPEDEVEARDDGADATEPGTAAAVTDDASEAARAEGYVSEAPDDQPSAPVESSAEAEAEPEPEPEPEPAPRLDPAELKAIVEALVFAAPEPVTIKALQKVLAEEPIEGIELALAELTSDYEGRGLQLAQVAGGYQITTRSELHEWVRRLFHERTTQKLSVQALETLAVIAYRQPVTAAEITEIRGVNASGVLSTLLERHLVKIVGRRNVVGRPFLYGTTREFLIRFGLKDVTDLPKMEDMVAALGFEPPALLVEKPVAEEMLPLEEAEVDLEDRVAPADDSGSPESSE